MLSSQLRERRQVLTKQNQQFLSRPSKEKLMKMILQNWILPQLPFQQRKILKRSVLKLKRIK